MEKKKPSLEFPVLASSLAGVSCLCPPLLGTGRIQRRVRDHSRPVWASAKPGESSAAFQRAPELSPGFADGALGPSRLGWVMGNPLASCSSAP